MCALSAFGSCYDTFSGGDWFFLALRGYCALTRLLLCDIGL
jgi:hypothetical protein